jgi:hypothetical protein
LNLTVYPRQDTVIFNAAICYGANYTANGFNITNATASDVYFNENQNINNCDSVTRLNLTVYPRQDTVIFNAAICYGASYTANGFNITNATVSNVYFNENQNINYCDSVTRLNLTVYPKQDTVIFNAAICYGANYTANGFNITNAAASNVYFNENQNINYCDSVTRLNLTVYPKQDTVIFNAAICYGASYTANGFNITNAVASNVYFNENQNINYCDSVTRLNLTVYPKQDTVIFNAAICYGASYTANGFNITNAAASNVYFNENQNINNCDSVTRLNLTVFPKQDTVIFNAAICYGANYTANGFNITNAAASNVYFNENQNINNCDSVTRLNLTVYPQNDTTFITAEIAQGETYLENGFNENSTGRFERTDSDINDCNSVIVLYLTVTSGINNIFENSILIYPNPAETEIFIETKIEIERVELLDVTGRILIDDGQSKMKKSINISLLPSGVYLVRITVNNQVLTKKIIKK